jgi:hypothetical protein
MCDKKYNGWSNWETWNANLWINELDGMPDEILAQASRELEDFMDEGNLNIADARYSLGNWLEGFATETFFGHIDRDSLYGPAADAIFHSYIPEVDWYEIAEHYVREAQEAL